MNSGNITPGPWVTAIEDIPWTPYVDPHLPGGPDVAMVKILEPCAFYVWFKPGFRAPAHAHPHDTYYFVTEGAIRFGEDEQWVLPNSVRGVPAGHVYGPEVAHPDLGVRFLIISSGPITIDWVDH